MKTALFINTHNLSNEEIKTFILTVNAFKNIKCDLSPFDIDMKGRRQNRPLLITLIDNTGIKTTDIWNFEELASLGREGYNLISCENLEEYAKKIANQYKYC